VAEYTLPELDYDYAALEPHKPGLTRQGRGQIESVPVVIHSPPSTAASAQPAHLDVLREVENRVLWLSTAMVDHANRVRPKKSGLKVGGHQASSASITTIMTALWMHQLHADDRV
jgi:pyruvate dehydrogenase E1 component